MFLSKDRRLFFYLMKGLSPDCRIWRWEQENGERQRRPPTWEPDSKNERKHYEVCAYRRDRTERWGNWGSGHASFRAQPQRDDCNRLTNPTFVQLISLLESRSVITTRAAFLLAQPWNIWVMDRQTTEKWQTQRSQRSIQSTSFWLPSFSPTANPGVPSVSTPPFCATIRALELLRRLPNVCLDSSGVGTALRHLKASGARTCVRSAALLTDPSA